MGTGGKRIAAIATAIVVVASVPAGAAGAPSGPTPPGPEVAPGVFLAAAQQAAGSGQSGSPSGTVPSRTREPRVVGGQPTTIEQWPWQVAVADNPSFGGDGFDRQFCGGSLVAPNIVITAAHCTYDVFDSNGSFDAPSNFSVITGRTTLSSSAGQEIPVTAIHFFTDSAGQPLYNPDTITWDAVFLELAGNSTSGTIKLAGADEGALWAAGQAAFATGWGSTQACASPLCLLNPGSDNLREVQIHMISDSECSSDYGSDFFPETQVCAGESSGGKDTCNGDSGGPLVVSNPAGGFRLVGDTSWGEGCAQAGFPGVYGRIADDPLRTALQNGIMDVACVDVVGAGPPPTVPLKCDADSPQTKIKKHPRRRIHSDKRRVRVRFRFNSDESGSSFKCKLDGRPFKSCKSPKAYRLGTPGDPRKHVFKVRATDKAGNTDPTPAKFRFKVSS